MYTKVPTLPYLHNLYCNGIQSSTVYFAFRHLRLLLLRYTMFSCSRTHVILTCTCLHYTQEDPIDVPTSGACYLLSFFPTDQAIIKSGQFIKSSNPPV